MRRGDPAVAQRARVRPAAIRVASQHVAPPPQRAAERRIENIAEFFLVIVNCASGSRRENRRPRARRARPIAPPRRCRRRSPDWSGRRRRRPATRQCVRGGRPIANARRPGIAPPVRANVLVPMRRSFASFSHSAASIGLSNRRASNATPRPTLATAPFGKQPAVAAVIVGAEKNIGRIVRQDQRHRDLPRIDEVAVDLPNRRADARVRTVGADQHSRPQTASPVDVVHRAVGVDGQDSLAVSALGSVPRRFVRQHAVEGAAVDHEAVKMLGDLRRCRAPTKVNMRVDLLLGHRAHAGNVVLDQGSARIPRIAPARRRSCRRSSATTPRPAAAAIAAARLPAGPRPTTRTSGVSIGMRLLMRRRRAGRPSRRARSEQQAWSCSIGRPMARASATIPSAG